MILSTVCSLLLLIVQCHGKLRPRIFNGEPASRGKFPYVAAFLMPDATDDDNIRTTIFCGGVIISELWILTAASCVIRNLNPFDFKVLVGTNDLNNGGILKEYDFRIPHENFTRINNTFRDDIGLVKLKDPLQFSDDIKPISFPIEDPDLYSNSSDLFYSYNFTFAGWGLTIFNGLRNRFPDDLRYTIMTIYKDRECSLIHKTRFIDQFCAISKLGQTPCWGDSGMPLVRNNVVYGIISVHGGEFCSKKYPTIFTNVYRYRQWINNTIKKFEEEINY